jgi:hypothetical protein
MFKDQLLSIFLVAVLFPWIFNGIKDDLKKFILTNRGITYLTKWEKRKELKKLKYITIDFDHSRREYYNITGFAIKLIKEQNITANESMRIAQEHVLAKRLKKITATF